MLDDMMGKPRAPRHQISKKEKLQAILKGALVLEAKNLNQSKFMKAVEDPTTTLVIGSGCAGTGKTLLSLAGAINLLYSDGNIFEEIIIFKSVKMLDGEDIGYLPGTKDDKLKYVYQSYYMQLEKLVGKASMDKMVKDEFIKVLPLGSIRGMSIGPKTIVIVDETQNLNVEHVHTTITRMEAGAKLICIGDIFQRDHRNKIDNGLLYLTDRLNGIDASIAVIEFTKEDSVRSKLIQHFQQIYEDFLDEKDQLSTYQTRTEINAGNKPMWKKALGL